MEMILQRITSAWGVKTLTELPPMRHTPFTDLKRSLDVANCAQFSVNEFQLF
jgi:hypothetical protein